MEEILKLQAIEQIKANPEIIKIMADFKRVDFVGSYIMAGQIESEEELAHYWLNDIKQTIYRKHSS